MVAHAKGYLPPPCVVLALLAMTGELASCSWRDPLPDAYAGEQVGGVHPALPCPGDAPAATDTPQRGGD